MREVFIIGVGMTRFGAHADRSVGDLAREAVGLALSDAEAEAGDLEAVFYANTAQGAIEGQHGVKGQHALRPIGVEHCLFVNVEDACAGSSAALNLAFAQVAGGFCDIAMAVGAEKLNTPDKVRRLAAFSQPEDLAAVTAFVETYSPRAADIQPPPGVVNDERMRSIFMDAYSVNARLHMKKYGTTWEQIAQVSAKNHHHSTMNPLAQFQKEFPLAEILAARVISWPLTLPMCAPVSDGASAVIVCSREALARFDERRAVRILASVLRSGSDRDIEDVENASVRLTAKAAFKQAGLKPSDISLAEVHDASAYAEIAQIEMVGLCNFGEGGPLTASGATALGGRIPVNVSGGLQSKGHPVAATGAGQIYELVQHLRNEAGQRQVEGARYALASCSGGFIGVEDAAACATILGRA
ncbi:MAG: thiolase family protein [Hyphomonadaceae bacterium]|nr:thiolase family protein [Hyphomonadaceae bacterium]